MVALLRQQPGSLRGTLMRIPLHTEPVDTQHLAELVQSVMCGSRSQCETHYSARPASTPQDAVDLADAADPLLQLR